MPDLNVHARRATVDDLPALRGLWQTAMLPAHDLEKHLTDFQLVEGLDGRLMGALGFQVVGQHARIYHEAYTHASTEARVKPPLWNRLKVMAANEGVHRMWTQLDAPFWEACGFQSATADDLEQIPPAFKQSRRPWTVLALRDEAAEKRIEREIGLFEAVKEEDQSRLLWQTRMIKWCAGVIATVFCSVLLYYTIKMLVNIPRFR